MHICIEYWCTTFFLTDQLNHVLNITLDLTGLLSFTLDIDWCALLKYKYIGYRLSTFVVCRSKVTLALLANNPNKPWTAVFKW